MVVGGKTYDSFAVSSPLMAKELLRQILVACIHRCTRQELTPPEDAYSDILPDLPRAVAKRAFNAMIVRPLLAQPKG